MRNKEFQDENRWMLSAQVQESLKTLRAEADEAKRCFTQFSFQALTVGMALVGLLCHEMSRHPHVGFTGLLVGYLMTFATRVGHYKYATANRNYGYELHTNREQQCYWKNEPRESTQQMLALGWEEAMLAWRIVQGSLFNAIYERHRFGRWFQVKKEHLEAEYKWWDTDELLRGINCSHYPGTYLKYNQIFLHALSIIALVPSFIASVYYIRRTPDELVLQMVSSHLLGWLSLIVTLGVSFHMILRIKRDRVHRTMLESGLLSIQTNAFVWRCVVVAHFRALEDNGSFKGYTRCLGEQAVKLTASIKDPHDWLEKPGEFPYLPYSGLRCNGGFNGRFESCRIDRPPFL